ncbi:LysR family transcriptional regulator [Alteromonas halophila]|uniref:Transcriptional regulator n=1 Tax=Alteromonas halophila TaxID=516698 RepID=A0A918MZP1_9ALTE|nr:LysR family transcriptional regulator [Alteromonas halophila]GGW89895.1 transcriptional regulator [Alteromonas halophila]
MLKATLEQWRMFKAVADAGGFNQAAEQVHKSQSSVHHAVQKLENALGVPLFESEGRRIKLTGPGELMLRRANFLLNEAQKTEAVAHSMQSGAETVLRVAVDIIFPSEVLYAVLDKVSEDFPLLRIEVEEAVLSGANSLLKAGNVDLAISALPISEGGQQEDAGNGFSEDLCQIGFIAAAHPEHPLHQLGRPLHTDDLKAHRQIVVRDSSTERKTDYGWLGAEQRWTVSHIRTSIDIICKGLGFAWLPLAMIEPYINAGQLKPLPMESGGCRNAMLYLNFEDGDCLGPAARTFIGELRYRTMALPTAESIDSSLTKT